MAISPINTIKPIIIDLHSQKAKHLLKRSMVTIVTIDATLCDYHDHDILHLTQSYLSDLTFSAVQLR